MAELIADTIYLVSSEKRGAFKVKFLGMKTALLAHVEVIDEMESTIQLEAGYVTDLVVRNFDWTPSEA